MLITTKHSIPYRIAVVAPADLRGLAVEHMLTDRELVRWGGIQHPARRVRWPAGRLAAKYLYLDQLHPTNAPAPRGPRFTRLTARHLNGFVPAWYRRVEVLPPPGKTDGPPGLIWARTPTVSPRVSLSHVDGLACATLAPVRNLGLDLERVEVRRDAFYLGTFTPREHKWVGHLARTTPLTAAWGYTLLWTVKEAFLKANLMARPISVWDFPKVDVTLHLQREALCSAGGQATLGTAFLDAPTRIVTPEGPFDVEVILTATPRQVLTLLSQHTD